MLTNHTNIYNLHPPLNSVRVISNWGVVQHVIFIYKGCPSNDGHAARRLLLRASYISGKNITSKEAIDITNWLVLWLLCLQWKLLLILLTDWFYDYFVYNKSWLILIGWWIMIWDIMDWPILWFLCFLLNGFLVKRRMHNW